VDKDRHSNGRFVLTGSQHFVLMNHVGDSLAGRAAVFELENLSLRELVTGLPLESTDANLRRLLCRGQFPEL